VKIERRKNQIFFFNSYLLKDTLRALGCEYDRRTKAVKLDPSADAIEILEELSIGYDETNWTSFALKLCEDIINDIKLQQSSQFGDVKFINDLYDHQQFSVNFALNESGNYAFADLSEPGTGKTRVEIELVLQREPLSYPVLIICRKSLMHEVWHQQVSNLTDDSITCLDKGGAKAQKSLCLLNAGITSGADLIKKWYVVTYDTAWRIVDDLKSIKWGSIICDESTAIKNPTAKRTAGVLSLRDIPKFKSIMTGTPMPRSYLDLFSQFLFLDSTLFGTQYYRWRDRYFKEITRHSRNGEREWKEQIPITSTADNLQNRIKTISVKHKKRNCVDLPPLVHVNRPVAMGVEQSKAYRQMAESLIIEMENETIRAPFSTTKILKLRQICSGFIMDENHESHIIKGVIPKQTELNDILSGEMSSQQMIVFVHFKMTGKLVNKSLIRADINVEQMTSSMNNKSRSEVLKAFEDNQFQVLLTNAQIAGHGLNLQFCSNISYYEHDHNFETYEQSWQRVERIGQKNKMTIFHFLTPGTVEIAILRSLLDKKRINDSLTVNEFKNLIYGKITNQVLVKI